MAANPVNIDLDTERMILGQILDWPEAFALYAGAGLCTTDFYRSAHAFIWDAACEVAEDGQPTGQPTISARLRAANRWEEVSPAYFGRLTDGVPRPNAGVVAALAQRLRDLGASRRGEQAAQRFIAACQSPDGLDADTLASHVAQLDHVRAGVEPVNEGDAGAQLAALRELAERGDVQAVQLGLPTLDAVLGGVQAGDVCGILARTSVGKTILAVHVARTAAHAGLAQVLFSLEMPTGAITERLARATFGLSKHALRGDVRAGRFDSDTYARTFANLTLIDTPGLSLERIEQLVRTQQRRHPVSLVIVDYLGLIGAPPNVSTYDRVSQSATGLKTLAKRCRVAVVVLIQASRAGGADGSERLSLTAARDAGVIEEALDTLIGIRRVDHALKLSEDQRQRYADVLWADVLKNRHGDVSRQELAIRINPTSLALTEDAALQLDEATVKALRRAPAAGGF